MEFWQYISVGRFSVNINTVKYIKMNKLVKEAGNVIRECSAIKYNVVSPQKSSQFLQNVHGICERSIIASLNVYSFR